jgi:uncharacterized protein (TIGR00299 family) protein
VKILHFDCFSGAAGDMILGALLDAGLSFEDLRRALGSLAIDRDLVWTERVVRAGVAATKFRVRGEEPPADHAHDHDGVHQNTGRGHAHEHHGHTGSDRPRGGAEARRGGPGSEGAVGVREHHQHRSLGEIGRLIDASELSAGGKDRAKALFHRLAEAEAAIHDMAVDDVHLHEVGALDSIIDVVGTVYGLEALGVERVTASPLNVGGGMVRSAHGTYPVPAPATARLLRGAPIYAGPQPSELVTPTGALLVTGYAESYGPVPPMRLIREGYGAGSRDFADTPNVVRVFIGEAETGAAVRRVVVIEAEIDDMNPQIFGTVMDQLLAAGALDVFYTPIQMKKNRPGTLVSIIAPPDARERLTALVFRETTTIGVRCGEMDRECLDRETVTVDSAFGPVRVKVARRHGEVVNVSPEFEDCVRRAGERGAPVKDVHAAALNAYADRGSRSGA